MPLQPFFLYDLITLIKHYFVFIKSASARENDRSQKRICRFLHFFALMLFNSLFPHTAKRHKTALADGKGLDFNHIIGSGESDSKGDAHI